MKPNSRCTTVVLVTMALLAFASGTSRAQPGADGKQRPATETRAPAPLLVDLFVSGEGGYHTYRIPALVVTKTGVLLAICEGRKTSRADHGDVDIVARRSTDGGASWGPLYLIHEEGGDAKTTIGNPCPVVDQQTGVIWLPLTRNNDDVLLTSSADDGATWTAPRVITSSVKRDDWTWYATGPGNGIQLTRGPHRGRLVIPCDHRIASIADRRKSSRSHVIYSDDHGTTWQIGGVTDFLMNECAVAELADGSLLLNMRSNRGVHCRGIATSTDGGLTWSDCTNAESLVEPVCQASMIRYTWGTAGDRSRLLFCNPASASGRQHLTVRVSYDEGRTWPRSRLLYGGSAAYSSLAALPARRAALLFERDDYTSITYLEFDQSCLEENVSP